MILDLFNQIIKNRKMKTAYYKPSDSYEDFDGEYFYNNSGDRLRDPEEYNPYSEGYTPFGDE